MKVENNTRKMQNNTLSEPGNSFVEPAHMSKLKKIEEPGILNHLWLTEQDYLIQSMN